MIRGVKFVFLVLAFSIILFANLVLADFSVGSPSHSIDGTYGPSNDIKGWINISLNDEPSNSLFEDSRGNSISLIDLLKKNSSYSYSCDPIDCSTDYGASNGAASKTFSLGPNSTGIYGLRFTGNLIAVNSVQFNVQSNATASCTSQIKVDVLDDGKTEVTNNRIATGGSCGNLKSYGCFSSSSGTEQFTIQTTPYCQRIELSESPGFTIGAWVRKVSGSSTLIASLYDSSGFEVGNCQLPDATTSGGEVSCNVSYATTKPQNHYVCVYSSSGGGDYRIRGNSNPVNSCGFFGIPIPSNTPGSYEIFAQGRRFGSVGTINVQDSLPNGQSLGSMVHNYILDRYGSFDCSSECVVPIRFISGVNQQITLSNLDVNYQKNTGFVTETNFYELSETPALVSSNFQRIYLDQAGFSVPNDFGDYEFNLDLDGEEIFSQEVNVSDIPQIISVRPGTTAAGFPTEFTANIESPVNTTSFFWEFGDGLTSTTTTNKVTHTYSSVGIYQLKLTVTDSRLLSSSRTFQINVSSPKDLIDETIDKMRTNVDNLNSQLINFDLFSQQSIKNTLGLNNATAELDRLETLFDGATTEEEYGLIIADLLKLDFPNSITETKVAKSIPFFIDRNDVDLGTISTISGGTYDFSLEEEYINGVLLWNQQNLDIRLDFTEFSGEYDGSVEPVLRVFRVSVGEKTDITYSYFLVLPKLINLDVDVVEMEQGSYIYVDAGRSPIISFSTTENIDFLSLPMFISPGISRLQIVESLPDSDTDKGPRRVILILALVLLIAAGLITYFVLQQWYKKKYESYLFKNRNDLYNMVTYVNHAKKRGLTQKEISDKLKKAKWSSEQINYVMKKYAGKRTGMAELPLTGLIKRVRKTDHTDPHRHIHKK